MARIASDVFFCGPRSPPGTILAGSEEDCLVARRYGEVCNESKLDVT